MESPMMDYREILDLCKDLCADHIGVDLARVSDNAKLGDDLGADSLDCVELTVWAEERFNVAISDDEADRVVTVADMANLVARKQAAAVAA
jgi:acyl carrier protein